MGKRSSSPFWLTSFYTKGLQKTQSGSCGLAFLVLFCFFFISFNAVDGAHGLVHAWQVFWFC